MSTNRTPAKTLFVDVGTESKAPPTQDFENPEFKRDYKIPLIPHSANGGIPGIYWSIFCLGFVIDSGMTKPRWYSWPEAICKTLDTPLRSLYSYTYQHLSQNGIYADEKESGYNCALCLLGTPYKILEIPFASISCLAGYAVDFGSGFSQIPKSEAETSIDLYLKNKNLRQLIDLFYNTTSHVRDTLITKFYGWIIKLVIHYAKEDVSLHEKKQIFIYFWERGCSLIDDVDKKAEFINTALESKSNHSNDLLDMMLASEKNYPSYILSSNLIYLFEHYTLTLEETIKKGRVLKKYNLTNPVLTEIIETPFRERVIHDFFHTGIKMNLFGLFKPEQEDKNMSASNYRDVAKIIVNYDNTIKAKP